MIDTDQLRKALGENMRSLRVARGWTQGQFAERLGISRVQLNRIENGHHIPGADLLFTAADAFEVPADFLRRIAAPAA